MRRFLPPLPDARSRFHTVSSPIGELLLVGDGRAVIALRMEPFQIDARWRHDPEAFAQAEEQLVGYFDGELTEFDLPLAPGGSPFQLRVWTALTEIPYGTTTSYRELAASIGRPDAIRAVGATNGRNPIAVIVPCHRVIGADGSLTGFGGGLERKRLLLELEAAHAGPRLWAGA
jgi:methylated-DNA-[protein]-cysteine S-methyltransferase